MSRASFAERLRAARTRGGFNQSELGELVGAGQPAVTGWESADGSLPRSPEDVFRIEQVLGLDPGTLSRELGYVPVKANSETNVEAAILNDPHLREELARHLVEMYWVYRRAP